MAWRLSLAHRVTRHHAKRALLRPARAWRGRILPATCKGAWRWPVRWAARARGRLRRTRADPPACRRRTTSAARSSRGRQLTTRWWHTYSTTTGRTLGRSSPSLRPTWRWRSRCGACLRRGAMRALVHGSEGLAGHGASPEVGQTEPGRVLRSGVTLQGCMPQAAPLTCRRINWQRGRVRRSVRC